MKTQTFTGRIVQIKEPLGNGMNMIYVMTFNGVVKEYMTESRRIKLVGGRWFDFSISTAHQKLENICLFDDDGKSYYKTVERVSQFCNIEPSISAISDLEIKEYIKTREKIDHSNKFIGQDSIE